jgi:hypothetical protein
LEESLSKPVSELKHGNQLLGIRNRFAALSRLLVPLLAPCWRDRSAKEAFEGPSSAPATEASPEQRWIEAAEDVVTAVLALYTAHYMKVVRNFIYGLVTASIFLVLAATSYPFYPEQPILYVLVGLTGTVGATILYLLVQINKDELVSHLSGSTPNRFTPDLDFLGSVGKFILPVAGLLALQLAGTFRFLFEPILRMLR